MAYFYSARQVQRVFPAVFSKLAEQDIALGQRQALAHHQTAAQVQPRPPPVGERDHRTVGAEILNRLGNGTRLDEAEQDVAQIAGPKVQPRQRG